MLSSAGYNLIGCGDGLPGFGATGDQVGTLADPLDSRLGALTVVAGATPARCPRPGSPAIDAGDPAFQSPPAEDQRGLARVVSGRIDTGSVEVADAEIDVSSASIPIPDGGTLSFGYFDTPTKEVTRVLTIANTGTAPLLLGAPIVPANVIRLGQFPSRIEAGQSVDVSFKMTYSLASVSTGLLEFATSDADEDLYQITISTAGRCTRSSTLVSNTNDSGPGSLREAIASVCSDGDVYFSSSLSGAEIVLTSGPLLIERSMDIQARDYVNGDLAVSPTIRSNGASRLFEISGPKVLIMGFRLREGAATGPTYLATGANAANGGALFIGRSAAEGSTSPYVGLSDCQIEGNHATGKGGAVAIVDGRLRILSCALVGNRAGEGGGAIYLEGDSLLYILHNSTLSGNSIATGQGSAILFETMDLESLLLFNTINDNWSETEATGAVHLASSAPIKVDSCIIAGSRLITGRSGRGIANADVTGSGVVTSVGYNVIGSALPASGFVNGVNSDIVGVDPQLEPLDSTGSRTSYHMPRQTSPVIDHGGTVSPPFYDQRGGTRKKAELGAAYRADSGSIERDLRSTASNLTVGELAAHVQTVFPAQLILKVTDLESDPVPGVSLQLGLPALSGPSATILSENPATTDADGLTTISLQANAYHGVYQLTVTSTRPGFAPASIVLRNTTDPVIVCSDVSVSVLSAQSQAEIEAIMQPTASDPDGGSVSLQWDPPGPYDFGVTPVTLTATDDESETASCTATITIRLAEEVGWQFY
jgi:hypothetical protein